MSHSRAAASFHKPTTQSSSFRRPRHTIQTHSSPPPPALTGNQIGMGFYGVVRTVQGFGAHHLLLCCAPEDVLLRTRGCFAAHHSPMRSCHEKASNHLSNSLCRRRHAGIQSFKTHLLVVRSPCCQAITSFRVGLGSGLTAGVRDARPYRFRVFCVFCGSLC